MSVLITQNRADKIKAREFALPSRKIRVAASLPSVTAGEVQEAAERGLIDKDTIWYCFENGSKASQLSMKSAVLTVARGFGIPYSVFRFVNGSIENCLMDEVGEEIDYVFMDTCGFLNQNVFDALKKWEDIFSSDIYFAATFYLNPRYTNPDPIGYLKQFSECAERYGAYYRGKSQSPNVAERSLNSQIGLCTCLPFEAEIHTSWVYGPSNMLVCSAQRVREEDKRVPTHTAETENLGQILCLDRWCNEFELSLTSGQKGVLRRQLREGRTPHLKAIKLSELQIARLDKLYHTPFPTSKKDIFGNSGVKEEVDCFISVCCQLGGSGFSSIELLYACYSDVTSKPVKKSLFSAYLSRMKSLKNEKIGGRPGLRGITLKTEYICPDVAVLKSVDEQSDRVSKQTKTGLQAAKAAGKKLGNNTNLRLSSSKKGREANVTAAARYREAILPKARKMRKDGQSLQSIADSLTTSGILTRRGMPWTATAVQRLLK